MGPRFAGAGEAWAARPFGARVLEFGLILSALAGLWVGVFAVLPGPGGVPLHLMTLGAFVGLASAMALAFSWALARRTAAWTRPRVPVLLAAQGLAWTWLLSQGSSQFAGDRALATALDLLALAWLLGGIACAKGWLVPQSSLQRVETLVLPGVLLPAGLALRLFPGYTPPPLGPVLGLAAAVLLGLAWLRPGPRRPWDRWDLAALALLWAAMVPVFLPYQTYSMDYYLGPLNGLWLGWHSWVQVGCQYGPGSVLFLEACFKALRCPPAWAAFSALHLLAFLAWFGALAWLLRSALRSRPLAWAGMAALLLGCYYQGTGMGNLPYPSTGPLRFGPPLLVVLACYARLRAQGRHWALDLLPWAALVVAAAWSLEVFVFALAGGLGMRLWECWGRPGWARRLGADLAVLAAALACWLAALSLGLRLHAGAWPDWAAYLQQVGAYGGGFGAVPLYRWSPWIFFPALAVASLAALIHRRVGGAPADPAEALFTGLSLQALAEFSYYLVRAEPSNLGHLCPLFLCIAFFWLDRAVAAAPGLPRLALMGVLSLGLCAGLWGTGPLLAAGLSHSVLGLGRGRQDPPGPDQVCEAPWSQVYGPVAPSPEAGAALALLRAQAPSQGRVAVFMKPCADVDVHLLSNTLDAFPVTNMEEDGLVLARRASILAMGDALQPGDVVLAGPDAQGGWDGPPAKAPPLAVALWWRTRQRFHWRPLPGSAAGVRAFRLELP